jgi:hypothetical protein
MFVMIMKLFNFEMKVKVFNLQYHTLSPYVNLKCMPQPQIAIPW